MNFDDKRTIVVTGGIGFIGSWYCDTILTRYFNYKVICVDKLAYCTSPRTVEFLTSKHGSSRFELIVGDICDLQSIEALRTRLNGIDYEIIHFAAESLVDTSFSDTLLVSNTNILGTMNMLDLAKSTSCKPTFLYMSTDEVYGEQVDCKESSTILQPTTLYAASKASAEHLVSAYAMSWKLDVKIIRCCNVYGPRQYPEKIVPIICQNLTKFPRRPTTLHGSGQNRRRYLYITDAINAIETIREKSKPNSIYNVGVGKENELTNVDLLNLMIELSESKESNLVQYGPDRVYNDWQYSMDCERIKALGWEPKTDLTAGLKECLQWAELNIDWFSPARV